MRTNTWKHQPASSLRFYGTPPPPPTRSSARDIDQGAFLWEKGHQNVAKENKATRLNAFLILILGCVLYHDVSTLHTGKGTLAFPSLRLCRHAVLPPVPCGHSPLFCDDATLEPVSQTPTVTPSVTPAQWGPPPPELLWTADPVVYRHCAHPPVLCGAPSLHCSGWALCPPSSALWAAQPPLTAP